MLVAQKNCSFKKALMGGMSIMAFTSMLAVSGYSLAAEIVDGATIIADDAAGLTETNEAGAVGVTLDASGGSFTIGADATPSLTVDNPAGQADLTVTITSTNSTSVTFADDVLVADDGDDNNDTLKINVTSGNVIFQGSIEPDGSDNVAITLGNTAKATATMQVNTVNNENIIITADIDAASEDDSVTLALANADNINDNVITFAGNIGSVEAIDSISIGGPVTAVFEGTVDAGNIAVFSTKSVTFEDDVTVTSLTFSADGTVNLVGGKSITGAISTTAADQGTLNIQDIGGANVTVVSGAVGGLNALNKITVDTGNAGGTAKFGGNVSAKTIEISGTETVEVAGNVTGAVEFSTDATLVIAEDKRITGTVDNKSGGDGVGTLTFSKADEMGDTTLVSTFINGKVGETHSLKTIDITTGDKTIGLFGDTVNADQIVVRGDGGVQFAGNVDTSNGTGILFDEDAAVTFNPDVVLDGDITTDTDGQGQVGFTANTDDITLVTGDIGSGVAQLKSVAVIPGAGKVATFAGTVNAQDININGTGTVSFSDDVTGTVNFTQDGTVTVAAGKSLEDVDNTHDSDVVGTLNIADAGSVSGDIGATEEIKALIADTKSGTVNLGGDINVHDVTITEANGIQLAAGKTLNISGDVTSGTGGVDTNGGDIKFSGTTEQNIALDIEGMAGDAILVENSKAEVIFAETITDFAGDVVIGATFKGAFLKTAKVENIDLDGEIRVEETITVDTNLDLADGAVITLGNGIEDTETAFIVGGVTSAGTTTVNLPATFNSGKIVLFDGAVDVSGEIANLSVTDNALITYALSANGNDVEITATARTAAETASELGSTVDVATALPQAVASADAADATGAAALNEALNTGGADATLAAEQVAVQADALGGVTTSNIATSTQVFSVASNRLASLRFGAQYGQTVYEGLATGDYDSKGIGMWLQPFGNWLSQDASGGVDGYDATTYGLSGGVDTFMDKERQYRIGASLSVSQTEVEGDGAGKSNIDINSYQFTVYTDFTGKAYYADLMAGYAYNSNETRRVINFGGLDRDVTGDYVSHQFMIAGNAGIPLHLRGTAYFTPSVGFNYTHVEGEEYTENGGGGFSQTVDPDAINVFITSANVKLHSKIRMEEAYLVPSITGGVSYDLIGDTASATATYTGGGAAFKVDGADVEQFAGNLGFGLGYEMDGFRVGFNYDAELKSGSIGHSARFEARVDF
ncbi:autotransporter domain-containing protein [Sneathiella sp. P13V-1]|uniref:autotransporter outer membrane beta-barrel domain-containing protein n=1 Tax=Sneathiella sp. P13V-1 TaxID=2697366 RepID=UPI00187B76E2|nr:autotransporter outer membrane beta-barrel domain-containing protein [Sneathiella sp. P13V-1]MBE7637862.1 autotransporter domain-containing protein [Sneathiella sp. P13V-1]